MLTCAFHSLCLGIPNEGTVFRPYHHIVAARFLLWSRGTDRTVATRPRRFTTRLGLTVGPTAETVQPYVNFVEPLEGNILNTDRYVHGLYSRKNVWIIDVEFHQPRNHLPVPFAIAIHDAKTGEPILRRRPIRAIQEGRPAQPASKRTLTQLQLTDAEDDSEDNAPIQRVRKPAAGQSFVPQPKQKKNSKPTIPLFICLVDSIATMDSSSDNGFA